jgi:ferredoxin-NADP reductase
MVGAALQRRLIWRTAEVAELVDETARVRSVVMNVPNWPGHRAGQHVDVRLTAEDGYEAQRSYSIASPPEAGERITVTVERIDDGEVSPFLAEELRVGD